MSEQSELKDPAVGQVIQQALAQLVSLVNTDTFQSQVIKSFAAGTGATIDQSLTEANYVVTITGFCDATTDVLADAIVGGDSMNYNECRVQKDAGGAFDVPQVAGVLLHEIAHNLGYVHPSVNPSRSTVPYFLGDLAQANMEQAAGGDSTGQGGTSMMLVGD